LPRDIGGALLFGVLVAGAITAIVPTDNQLQPYLGGGIVSILIMMAVGVPLYVCASASVPIAAGLIHLGASPGAALAFLISGPATNAATITTTWKLMGRRTALLYLLTVVISAVGCGLLLDGLFSLVQIALPHLDSGIHHHDMGEGGWFSAFWAIVLLAVIAFSYLRLPRKESGSILLDDATNVESNPREAADLVHLAFAVSGMTCGHCAETIGRTLRQSPGVSRVEVNLKEGRATVAGEHLDPTRLIAAVNALGYEMHLVTF
jgi:copper chaperone CopZ